MAQRKTKKKAAKPDAGASEGFDFEKGLDELERLVERMEQGDMSLEESLAAFERGVELTRNCQQALEQAEQKVEVLVEKAGGDTRLEELDPDEAED